MEPLRVLAASLILAGFCPESYAQDCLIRQGKLLPTSTFAQQQFGVACSVYRNTLAVLTSGGQVAVYTRSAGVWSLQQTLPSTWTTSFGGGKNLSLDRDTLLVGNPNHYTPPSGFSAGAVDVYVRSGTTWSLQTTLDAGAADSNADDQFGSALVLRGERAIIGAPGDDEAGSDAGAAYSFVRSGGVWSLETKLMNAGAAGGQLLGAVDFDGTRCIVGGAGGRTCIFARQGTSWTQEAEILQSGYRVGIDGSLAALWNSGSCASAGAPLHTFERFGSTWTQAADVLSYWGGDLSLRRQRIVAGRPGNAICSLYAHSALIHSQQGGSWQIDAAAEPGAIGSVGFGRSIAFDGATLLVGDPQDDQVATDAGAVWVFAVGPDVACPTNYCTAKLDSQQCTPWMFSNGESSASASSGFILGAGHVLSYQTGMALYGLSGRANLPFLGGTLCLAGPIHRGPVVTSSGSTSGLDCSGMFAFDMNAFAAGVLGGNPSPALLVPGTVVDVQWWARDPGFLPPDNVQLSAGQEYTVLP